MVIIHISIQARASRLQKQKLVSLLRRTGLLTTANRIYYLFVVAKYYRRNKTFGRSNPDFKVPPRALAFDAYSAPDWAFYKTSGSETAAFLSAIGRQHLPEDSALRILEWGCGPGRVIRNVPSAFGPRAQVYGSDYNEATIEWCAQNIRDVEFVKNDLVPPLPFASKTFDFVYSISVLTHLSEAVCHQWMDELRRVTHPGSVLVITTNGDSFVSKLLPDEVETYKSQGIVVRGNVEEGKGIFSTCHSPAYLREKVFRGLEVLDFAPAGFPYTAQDMWVLRNLS